MGSGRGVNAAFVCSGNVAGPLTALAGGAEIVLGLLIVGRGPPAEYLKIRNPKSETIPNDQILNVQNLANLWFWTFPNFAF
jgi:hypothetical protein